MKKTKNSLNKVYQKYLNRVDNLIAKDPEAGEFFELIKNCSDTQIESIARQEIKVFDIKWIDSISNGLNAIDNIIKDPKKFIKTTGVLTPIELAKRTTSESIIHLSSHSQYVKNIDEKGNIMPDKILNIEAEDDYAIYENRFVKTLITKLLIFIERRYEYIRKHADTRDTDIIVTKSKLTVGETTFELEQKVKVSTPSFDEGNREYNQELLDRIKDIRARVHFFADSELMRELKDAKMVPSPIQQTNIIRKNKNYHQAYELFKFLDSYEKLGLSIKVKETKATFDEEYLKKLYYQIMFAELTLETSKRSSCDLKEVKARKIKPKVNHLNIKDPALSDSKFNIPFFVGPSKAEIARQKAKEKAKKEKEERRAKLLSQKEREKARLLAERERERIAKEKEREREKERRAREREREKERLALKKKRELERKLEKERRDAELQRVIKARKKVAEEARLAKIAREQKERERLERQKEKERQRLALKKEKELARKKLKEERALQKKLEREEA